MVIEIKWLKSEYIKIKADDFWKYLRIPFDNEWGKKSCVSYIIK